METPGTIDLTPNHPLFWLMDARGHYVEACQLMLYKEREFRATYDKMKAAEPSDRLKIMFGVPVAFAGGAHLLMGLAIEVSLKGIWICRNDTKRAPKFWRTAGHNLLELAKHARVKFTRPERQQLEYYTDHIVWVSKYPASFLPTKSKTWETSYNVHEGAGMVMYKKVFRVLCEEYGKWEARNPDHPFSALKGSQVSAPME